MKKLLATLALAIGAQAHAANMQFDGTVSTGCSLQVNQNGTLAIDPSTPYQLSTSAIGGLPGTVNVSYQALQPSRRVRTGCEPLTGPSAQ